MSLNIDNDQHPPLSFSWARLIADTRLTGLTAMLACYCEPTQYDASIPSLRLELADSMVGLKSSPAMDMLSAAMKDYFGDKLELEVVTGPALRAPALLANAKRVESFTAAFNTIATDKLVTDMIAKYGAKVLVESVKPVTPSPGAGKKPT